jgi:hypothetical protein
VLRHIARIGPVTNYMNRPNPVFSLLTALALLDSCCLVSASSQPTPYSEIPERNVFALKPILPQARTNVIEPVVAPKIALTGITTILGSKLALLKVHFPSTPAEPAYDLNLALTEGETQDGFKILEIHEDNASATVEYLGNIYTLNLALNPPGARLSASVIAVGKAER